MVKHMIVMFFQRFKVKVFARGGGNGERLENGYIWGLLVLRRVEMIQVELTRTQDEPCRHKL